MRSFFLFLVLFLGFKSLLATNYYISSEGDDDNSGTSIENAWRSLERLNKLVPKPGDSILFRRGDSWEGSITVNMWGFEDKPLYFGVYGKGPKPKIYGSEEITGWEKHDGNILKAKFNKTINQLFVDGERMQAARYPNEGYIFITSVKAPDVITADELDARIDYTGSRWFGRTNYFTTSLLEVKSSDAKTLTLDSEPRFPFKPQLGFFLVNKLEFLDKPGEWYYDQKSQTVYLWPLKNDSPDNYSVRGSVYSDGMLISGKRYVTIQGLHFLHQSEKGVHLRNSNHITIKNNEFSWQDGFGIYCQTDADNLVIEKNEITGVNHYGMYLRISHSLISENKISKVALFDNIGLSGTGEDNFGGGIYLAGEKGNNIVRHNRITEMGFTGILFARQKNIIEYNFIKDVCLLKGDMGGIYTSWYKRRASSGPDGSIIRNNIILNVVGEKYGYTSKRHMGEGIYIDESATGVLIENNTIAFCSNSGIKLHQTEDVSVVNNTIVDARQSIHVLKSGTKRNLIKNNILVSVRNEDDYLKRQVLINSSEGLARYDHNEYVSLHRNNETFLEGSSYNDFGKWKLISGEATTSKIFSIPLSGGEKEYLFFNDSSCVKKLNIGQGIFRDLKGNRITGNLSLQPFTSIVLIGKR
ncbi:MAG TPA: right-handed parallel beta-helix repeat-containing protein [Mariniphaga sp.]|nr:right-handed parallel beta-helix repeat-containing protein [Mariniphaga sp.]